MASTYLLVAVGCVLVLTLVVILLAPLYRRELESRFSPQGAMVLMFSTYAGAAALLLAIFAGVVALMTAKKGALGASPFMSVGLTLFWVGVVGFGVTGSAFLWSFYREGELGTEEESSDQRTNA